MLSFMLFLCSLLPPIRNNVNKNKTMYHIPCNTILTSIKIWITEKSTHFCILYLVSAADCSKYWLNGEQKKSYMFSKYFKWIVITHQWNDEKVNIDGNFECCLSPNSILIRLIFGWTDDWYRINFHLSKRYVCISFVMITFRPLHFCLFIQFFYFFSVYFRIFVCSQLFHVLLFISFLSIYFSFFEFLFISFSKSFFKAFKTLLCSAKLFYEFSSFFYVILYALTINLLFFFVKYFHLLYNEKIKCYRPKDRKMVHFKKTVTNSLIFLLCTPIFNSLL